MSKRERERCKQAASEITLKLLILIEKETWYLAWERETSNGWEKEEENAHKKKRKRIKRVINGIKQISKYTIFKNEIKTIICCFRAAVWSWSINV